MNIIYSKRAVKAIERMDGTLKKRIRQSVNKLPDGDVKKMQGHALLYRLRAGDWRIVFSRLDDKTIIIEKISSRGEVYKGGI